MTLRILEIVKRGEGKKIEFKSIMPSGEKIAKTLIAFANTAGGKLIIGVADNGEILGINNFEVSEKMDRVSNIIHDMIYPMIVAEIYTYNIENRVLLIMETYPSPIKPHYLRRIGRMDGTYIRVGATNKKADFEFIQELERQKMNTSFDEDLWVKQDVTVDNEEIIKVLSESFKRKILDGDLDNLKLVKSVQNKKVYTNAVPILSDRGRFIVFFCCNFYGKSTQKRGIIK